MLGIHEPISEETFMNWCVRYPALLLVVAKYLFVEEIDRADFFPLF